MTDDPLKDKILKVRDLEAEDGDHIEAMYSKPSHRERMRVILELMAKYVCGKEFLDIGCAEGLYCNEAYKLKAGTVLGLDVSSKKIKRARELFPGIDFRRVDSDNMSNVLNKKFDFILCTEVLQHIYDYKKTLREAVSVLKKTGFLLLSIPNLSKDKRHIFANISDNMTVGELLHEIGGAGYGKQNAVWKFNADLFKEEIVNEYPLELVKMVPINTPDGMIQNLWTVFLLRKRE